MNILNKIMIFVIIGLFIGASVAQNINVNAENNNNKHEYSLFMNVGNQYRVPINNIKLDDYEEKNFSEKLTNLRDELQKVKIDEQSDISKEIIDLYREYNLIPSSFSLVNMSQMFQENQNSNLDLDPPLLMRGMPYIGAGIGFLTYVSIFGTVTPFGFYNLTTPHAMGAAYSLNLTFCESGVILESDFPSLKEKIDTNLENGLWPLNGPFWHDIWEKVGNTTYKVQFGGGIYMIHFLAGHSLNFGFIWSLIPLMGQPSYSNIRVIKGSFWYFGGATFPVTFVLYKTYPQPWTTYIDFGFQFNLGGQVLLPLWFRDNPIE